MTKFLSNTIVKLMIFKGRLDVKGMRSNAKNARKVNEKLLFKILKTSKNCRYGKKYDFQSIKSVDEYQKRLPVTTYDDYAPDIERAVETGENGVLTSLKIVGYAKSSGSVGHPKSIPLTNPEVAAYVKYTITRCLALCEESLKKQGKKLKAVRGILALPRFDDLTPRGLPFTNVASVAALRYGFLYPYILVMPLGHALSVEEININYYMMRFGLMEREAMYLFSVFITPNLTAFDYLRENWRVICDDIERGEISDSIANIRPDIKKKLLKKTKPAPERAAELRAEFEKGFDGTIISRIWPNMSVICNIATSATFRPQLERFMNYSNNIPVDYSIYGASEGLFAACYKTDDEGQMMLPDSCFYEFIDQDTLDEDHPLLINELEVGKEYEMLVTNQAGLYRYKFGDVIRVLDYEGECPIITFAYRKGQLFNLNGEKTTLEHMTEALRILKERHNFTLNHWAAYEAQTSDLKDYYCLLLESEDNDYLSDYSKELDDLIKEINPRYLELGDSHGDLIIKQLKPGAHEAYKQLQVSRGASALTYKPVVKLDTQEKIDFFNQYVIE